MSAFGEPVGPCDVPREDVRYAMGVDLSVVMSHRFERHTILELPQRLASSKVIADALAPLNIQVASGWPHLANKTPAWPAWASTPDAIVSAWENRETVPLDIGIGATLDIGCHMVELTHVVRYAMFVENVDAFQAPLRRFANAVATELGSDRVVYLPDSTYELSRILDLVNEDVGFDAFCERLLAEFGPPAPTISAIYVDAPEGYSVNGYFIDEVR